MNKLFLILIISIYSNAQAESQIGHLRLADKLDRHQDGYCLDALGTGSQIRFDMPLIAHNCKLGLSADEAVTMRKDGTILFPIYNKCLTVAGVNTSALPGVVLMMQSCDEQSPFVNGPAMQKFVHRSDGRIQMKGGNLCMTVSNESDQTFSPFHRWRSLYMDKCDLTKPSRSIWEFYIPSKNKNVSGS